MRRKSANGIVRKLSPLMVSTIAYYTIVVLSTDEEILDKMAERLDLENSSSNSEATEMKRIYLFFNSSPGVDQNVSTENVEPSRFSIVHSKFPTALRAFNAPIPSLPLAIIKERKGRTGKHSHNSPSLLSSSPKKYPVNLLFVGAKSQ